MRTGIFLSYAGGFLEAVDEVVELEKLGVDLALVADIGLTAEALLGALEPSEDKDRPQREAGRERCERVRHDLSLADDPELARYLPLFATLDEVLPEAIIVGDSTGPVYAGNVVARRPAPRRWFNAATGFGTLGYGLPAALGAGLARPDLPVVALVGDGGLMFTLSELATAVDAQTPIMVIVWNNVGFEEIRAAMDAAGVARCGVDPVPPDFESLADAFGSAYAAVGDTGALEAALLAFVETPRVTLIEIDAEAWMASG